MWPPIPLLVISSGHGKALIQANNNGAVFCIQLALIAPSWLL